MTPEEVAKVRQLLTHKDPDIQRQGLELAKSFGDYSAVFEGCSIDEAGRIELNFGPANLMIYEGFLTSGIVDDATLSLLKAREVKISGEIEVTDNERTARTDPVMFFLCVAPDGTVTDGDSKFAYPKGCFDEVTPLCIPEWIGSNLQWVRPDASQFRDALGEILSDDVGTGGFYEAYEYTSGYNTYEDDEDNDIDDFVDSYSSWCDGVRNGSIDISLQAPGEDGEALTRLSNLGIMRGYPDPASAQFRRTK